MLLVAVSAAACVRLCALPATELFKPGTTLNPKSWCFWCCCPAPGAVSPYWCQVSQGLLCRAGRQISLYHDLTSCSHSHAWDWVKDCNCSHAASYSRLTVNPSTKPHVMRWQGMSFHEIDDLLNKKSGFVGLSGETDLRVVLQRREQGDERAAAAYEVRLHLLCCLDPVCSLSGGKHVAGQQTEGFQQHERPVCTAWGLQRPLDSMNMLLLGSLLQ